MHVDLVCLASLSDCHHEVVGTHPHINYWATAIKSMTNRLHKVAALRNKKNKLENVQKLGLKLCSKQWDTGYHELLNMFSLPSLKTRRLHLKLCHLFKIVHGLCYFPPDIVAPDTNYTHFPRLFFLQQLFCWTNYFYHSFIPDTIRIWNTLPEHVVYSPSFVSFSNSLKCHLTNT